jgi:hypothetical protein
MSIVGVTRELLVRYLDTWTPTALHAARRVTFVQAWSGPADLDAAEAALRVFAEFADRLRGRRLTVVLVAPETAGLTGRLEPAQRQLGIPPELSVHMVAGTPAQRLAVALTAAGASGAPVLGYLDAGDDAAPAPLDALASGRPAELFTVGPTGGWSEQSAALHAAGFPLTTGVELVDSEPARLVGFATSSAKSLEAFKDCLWAVDEYAGVRYRDPRDPDRHLLDISLSPHPGPLRRELLAHLGVHGSATVTQLRHFALTETIFRAADAVRVITALVGAGAVTRTPERGRLSGDVVIALPAGA